ncbi:MAG TPA: hypothetical protein VN782_15195 [Usitatibacter sp.]|nr:hypothetical protein [Usitatibacter sp.]
MNTRELADRLCAISGFLRDVRSVHLRSFGTLVPRIFMSEVLARVGACLGARGANPAEADRVEIAGILESLEDGMLRGDRETRNVIAISFAGDAEVQPFFARLAPLLGPKVRAQLG